ncbi:hypothetical protein DPEC_G00259540 [Dallia pectoralis]|uniref:Uncharacterized protein n=1 Tax=Dallia pectoralis TaxID=75939 RepID=A0ACC2FRP0_DALPE|nr:hypothetical protein DPEC_G00259540 [Dallia pectoralis]
MSQRKDGETGSSSRDCQAAIVDARQDLTDETGKQLAKVAELEARLDEYENRQRRKNLRFVGFPEGVEGKDAVGFLENWLPEVLHIQNTLEIERTHRTMRRTQKASEQTPRPRAFVVKLLRYRDVMAVVEAA